MGGLNELGSAFDTVEKRIIRLTAAANQGSTARTRSARAEVDTAERDYKRLVTSLEKDEADKTRATERAAKARERIVSTSALMAGKLAEQQAKEEARAAEAGTRALEREMRARDRIRERSAVWAGQQAEREANAEIAAHRRIGTSVGRSVTQGTGRVLGGIASLGGMAVGALGAFSLADAVRGRFAAEKDAAQIVNAVTAGGKVPEGANVGAIIDRAQATSVTTGMSKDEIVKGTLAYTRSARGGDFAGAMGNMSFLAKLSKTTGTDIGELGSAAGKLQSQNPNLDAKGMQQLLLNAYEMSKSGSVSLGEAAGQIGTLAATRGFYQGDVGENQRKLMALGQIAASGGASGDIGTYIKDVSTEVAAKRRHTSKEIGLGGRGLEALGVHFDKLGAMESPEQMIGAIFKATGGDMSKIHGIVGNRGLPLFTELQKSFQTAGGGDAGVAAVQKQIAGVSGATMTPEQLESQFAQVMNVPAEKFNVAIERLRGTVEATAIPMIEKLADKLGDPEFMKAVDGIVNGLGALASFLVANPFVGVGAAVVASIGESIAKAGVGAAVKDIMTRVAAGESIPSAVATGKGAAIFGLVGGAVAGAVGVAGAVATINADKVDSEKRVKGVLAWNPQNDNERRTKAALLQSMLSQSKNLAFSDVMAEGAALPVNLGVNAAARAFGAKADVTGGEAAVARTEEAKAIRAKTAEIDKELGLLTKALRGATSTISSNHPSRNEPISGASPR
jgi:hypothetical protein